MKQRTLVLTFLTVLFSLSGFLCTQQIENPLGEDGVDSTGVLNGVVRTLQNEPIRGALVGTPNRMYGAATDSNGKFQIVGIPNGEYTFGAVRFGFHDTLLSGIKLDYSQYDTILLDIRMRAATATVKGKIVVPQKVSLELSSGNPIGVGVPEQGLFTLADENGEFSLTGIQPQITRIIAACQGVGWGEQSVSLVSDSVIEGIDITLDQTGGEIAGEVLDANSDPQGRVWVSAIGGALTDTTDENGKFLLGNVPSSLPIEISSAGNAAISGLHVGEGLQLLGVRLMPHELRFEGSISIRDASYILPDTSSVLLRAHIEQGKDRVSLFLWDKDNNGTYDSATSEPILSITDPVDQADEVGYTVVTDELDTLEKATLQIVLDNGFPKAGVKATKTARPFEKVTFEDHSQCLSGGVNDFRWDFYGNGIYEWTASRKATVSKRYPKVGTYHPLMRIQTSDGKVDSISFLLEISGDPVDVPDGILVPPLVCSPADTDTVVDKSFVLKWTSGRVAGATYQVYTGFALPPESLLARNLADTFLTVTPAENDTTHYFRVVAQSGDSAESSPFAHVIVGHNTPPAFVAGEFQPADGDTVSGDSIALTWKATDVNGHSIEYDVLFGSAESPSSYKGSLSQTSILVAPSGGFQNDQLYYWKIRARDGMDTTGSSVRSFRHLTVIPNTAPVFTINHTDMGNSAEVGKGYIDTVHATDADGNKLLFTLRAAHTGIHMTDSIVTWTPKAVRDTGLHQISAIVADNRGGYDTLTWNVRVRDLPPPAATLAVREVSATSVKVSWTRSTVSDFASYAVHYSSSPGVNASDALACTNTGDGETTCTIAGLARNTRYYFAVYVKDTTNQVLSNEVDTVTLRETYTIVATAGTGGTVTPSDTVRIDYGQDTSFTIAPSTGYEIEDVTVNGVSKGAITSYAFTNVTGDSAIAATFKLKTYTITASAGAGGTIAPVGDIVVTHGSDTSFTIAANPGCQIVDVMVDGASQGAITTHAFTNVTAAHTIAAQFNQPPEISGLNDTLVDNDNKFDYVILLDSVVSDPDHADAQLTWELVKIIPSAIDPTYFVAGATLATDPSRATVTQLQQAPQAKVMRGAATNIAPYGADTLVFKVTDPKGATDTDSMVAGAAAWKSFTVSGSVGNILGIHFVDAKTGFAVGQSDKAFKTIDRGATWSSATWPNGYRGPVNSVHFHSDQIGWAAGSYNWTPENNDGLYLTTDGGQTWKIVDSIAQEVNAPLYCIHFADQYAGWTVGGNGDGTFINMRSDDGGLKWHDASGGRSDQLYAVHCFSKTSALAVGESGLIIKTLDQGKNWTAINSGTTGDLNDVHFITDKIGFITGSYMAPSKILDGHAAQAVSAVLKTSDGGDTWSRLIDNLGGTMKAVRFVDEKVGWVAGGGYVYRTLDGGQNWKQIQSYPGSAETIAPFNGFDAITNNGFGITRYAPQPYSLPIAD